EAHDAQDADPAAAREQADNPSSTRRRAAVGQLRDTFDRLHRHGARRYASTLFSLQRLHAARAYPAQFLGRGIYRRSTRRIVIEYRVAPAAIEQEASLAARFGWTG